MKNILVVIDNYGINGVSSYFDMLNAVFIDNGYQVTLINVTGIIHYPMSDKINYYNLNLKHDCLNRDDFKKIIVKFVDSLNIKFDLILSSWKRSVYAMKDYASNSYAICMGANITYEQQKNAKIICISNFLADQITTKISTSHNEVITYPLYQPHFNSKLNDNYYNPYKNLDKPYILYQGRIGVDRLGNNGELAKLHKRLRNKFNLVISGSGNWDMLIKTFPKKSLNKTVFIHRDSIWPYHIIKDAFCTVNINRSEGLGISLIESIALNVPVLSYDNGGCTNTLEKYQPNQIVRKNNIKRMAYKINNLNPSINPNILKQFNWQVILTKYVNLMT